MKNPIAGVSLLGLVLIVWAFWIEPASLRVREYRLLIDDWPTEAENLRIALMSDLHVGSPFNGLEKLRDIVEETNHAAPDLILIAGDFVIHGVLGGQFVAPKLIAESLGQLKAPLGVFAVLGNHDWWFDAKEVRHALNQVGIPVLENESVRLRFMERDVWLAGIGDYWEGAPDLDAALAPVPANATTVLFTHNPDVFPEVPERVNLMWRAIRMAGKFGCPSSAARSCPPDSVNDSQVDMSAKSGVTTLSPTASVPASYRSDS